MRGTRYSCLFLDEVILKESQYTCTHMYKKIRYYPGFSPNILLIGSSDYDDF